MDLIGWEGPGAETERAGGSLPPNKHAAAAAEMDRTEAPRGVRGGEGELRRSRTVDSIDMSGEAEPTVDWTPESDSRAASRRFNTPAVGKKKAVTRADGRASQITGGAYSRGSPRERRPHKTDTRPGV